MPGSDDPRTQAELEAVVAQQQSRLEELSDQLHAVEREIRPYIEHLKRQVAGRTADVQQRNREIGALKKELRTVRRRLDRIQGSRSWRLVTKVRRLAGGRAVGESMPDQSTEEEVPAPLADPAPEPEPSIPEIAVIPLPDPVERYQSWIRSNDPTEEDLARMTADAAGLVKKPLISIITPVFDAPPDVLEAAIASVRRQVYPHWELLLVDDGSTSPAVRKLLEALPGADERIRSHFRERNEGITAASADGLSMATGAFVAFMDHDDVLAPHALYEVALAVQPDPEPDVVYSDEDKIDGGRRRSPFFKPDWCPNLLLSLN